MIPLDYKGKIVLVTGGGRGIGLAITRAFAEGGAIVVVTYISTDPTDVVAQVAEEFNTSIHVYHCPGEKSDIVNDVVGRISRDVGEIDIVIANAGVSLWREAIDMTDDEMMALMHTNLFAPFYLSRACVRHWLSLPANMNVDYERTERGTRDEPNLQLGKKILFVSSISGIVAMTPQPQMAYNASKAGLTMMAKSLAGEWAKYGITVNAISPGYIMTDMIANPPPGQAEAWVQKWHDMTPVGRFAPAKEVGDWVALLCSDRAGSFMTGSDVVVDGGYTIF